MIQRNQLPSQETLKELFKYHRDGYLIRLKSTGKSTKVGSIVKGCLHHTGYRYMRLPGSRNQVGVHRVIYKLKKGFLPDLIDHRNRDRSDNKISNLRDASHSSNAHNAKTYKNNKTGIKGLYFNKKNKIWIGQVKVDKKTFRVGCSKDKNKVIKKLIKLRKEKLKGMYETR